ncbi:subclass B1 metallo-beta-lactamase [Flavihumibacter sediminis]|nr:subclass B1 metallo-beta-lactamase [Flavihumibacter sediminis]
MKITRLKFFTIAALLLLFITVVHKDAFSGLRFPGSVPCFLAYSLPQADDTIYRSETLILTRISPNVYVHTTFLNTETWGKVSCNGMIVTGGKEALVFDTPADDSSSAELIDFINNKMNLGIKAVVPTHFHNDCLGGLKAFHKNQIPSLASYRTIALAKEKNFNLPQKGFKDSLTLSVANKSVVVKFFGEGHTVDNVVAYVPGDDVLFGGCLLKSLDAGKGNLEDANQGQWSETVAKVKKAFPGVKAVIPGHGSTGDGALLDFTINLFK